MATRQTRPRAIDKDKQLPIVRDISELDSTDGLPNIDPKPPAADGAPAAPTAEPVLPAAPAVVPAPTADGAAHHVKKPKPKEIPVPEVKTVPSYTRDYLPTFKIPDVYLRGRGGTAYKDDDFVEYDLDNEDEDWLEVFNRKQDNRLSDMKFERMLWKLELAWAESAEVTLTPTERVNAPSLASISHLPKSAALAVLRKAVGAREAILDAVYEYWARKRKSWGKPIMRRLQAPTPATDTNPFNVFRPREKPNRPLTRRRRENSIECIEKLRTLRENILHAMELAELLIIREQKKHDIMLSDLVSQQCQVALRHQQPAMHETIKAAAAARLKEIKAKGSQYDARLSVYAEANADALQGLAPATPLDEPIRQSLLRKRRRQELEVVVGGVVTNPDPVARLPPPLPPADPEPLFAYQCVLSEVLGNGKGSGQDSKSLAGSGEGVGSLPPAVAAVVGSGRARAFMGRGGRVVVARVDPVTMQPFEPFPPAPPPAPGSDTVGGPSSSSRVGPGKKQVVMDSLLFGWQQPKAEPWAATLDLALLPDYIDKSSFLEQRKRKLVEVDYKEQLATATANIQAAQAAQQAAAGASTTPGATASQAQAVPPTPVRPTPHTPFSRRVATLP